ncbi:RDD family protein [Ramlibacter rhizophilus]|uniref:RDD family protein n=1 Tax=Ramlibacter rhizophilus TaxID=1781167 RepID=A0A4Z0BXP4_9BURK|nr:RDD family protein [Ramlibacter rhizophilus]TFZ03472.1 RDD family protein [Ramlibacter rhizophilus]
MNLKPASLKRRVLAAVLDTAILFVLVLPAGMAVGFGVVLAGGQPDSPAVTFWGSLVGVLVGGVYSVWTMAGPAQSTWGQRAVGLRNYHLSEGMLDASTALGRYVVSMLSSSFFMLGYLTALFSRRRQTLHDMLLDTMVVDRHTHAWAMRRRGGE